MRLRAELVVEMDAVDYIEAADHQRVFETYFTQVREKYPRASCSFRHLRGGPAAEPGPAPVRGVRYATGALSTYREP